MKASSASFAFGTAAFFTCAAAVVGYAAGAFALSLGLQVDPGVTAAYSSAAASALSIVGAATVGINAPAIDWSKTTAPAGRTILRGSAVLAGIALLSPLVPSIGLMGSIWLAGGLALANAMTLFAVDKHVEATKKHRLPTQALQA